MLIRSIAVVAILTQVMAVGARFTTISSTNFASATRTSDKRQASPSVSSVESPTRNASFRGTLCTTSAFHNVTSHISKHGSGCHTNCTFTKVISNHGKWTKCQTEATNVVGKVMLIVDDNTNITTASTSYLAQVTFTSNGALVTSEVSEIIANGSQILTRTDVNAAGTVTMAVDGKVIPYPTTHHSISGSYGFLGTLPFVRNGTTSCVSGKASEKTPLPSVPPISTDTATPDLADPLGWTYCYDGGFYMPIEDAEWYSHFLDSVVGVLSNESVCKQSVEAWAPAVAVQQVPFLLETTTNFITRSGDSAQSAARTSTREESTRSTVSDPFQAPATANAVQGFTSTIMSPSVARPTIASDVGNHMDLTDTIRLSRDSDAPLKHGSSTASSFVTADVTRSQSIKGENPNHTDSESLEISPTKSSLETTSTTSQPSDLPISFINVAAQRNSDASRTALADVTSTFSKHVVAHTSTFESATQSDSDELLRDPTADPVSTNEGSSHKTGQLHHGNPGVLAALTFTGTALPTSHRDHDATRTIVTTTGNANLAVPSMMLLLPLPISIKSEHPVLPSAPDGAQSVLTSESGSAIEGQTLKSENSVITISGTTMSLISDVLVIAIDSSTTSLTAPPSIGGYIWAGINGATTVVEEIQVSTRFVAEKSSSPSTDSPGMSHRKTDHHSSTTPTADANNGESATALSPEMKTAAVTQEITGTISTFIPSTKTATDHQDSVPGANDSLSSEVRSGTPSTSTSEAVVISFGQRDTGCPLAVLQMAFSFSMAVLWL